MEAIVAAGYPYELIGLFYYVLFLFMGRKREAAKYSNRSRYLALAAAMAMVGCVPFHYASTFAGVFVMVALAVTGLASTAYDTFAARAKTGRR